MINDIEGSRDEVQRTNIEVVTEWLLRLGVDLPQYSDHAMEIEFPSTGERYGDVEEISPAVVEFIEEEVFVNADVDVLLT